MRKVRNDFFRDSQCIGKWLHRFSIVAEYPEGVMENCEICHKSRFFKLIDEKVNNQEYMNSHFRNALPPSHPFFFHEYLYDPFSIEEIISPYAEL